MELHDLIHKRLFRYPAMVEDLIRHFLPGQWTESLDFSTLEPCPAEFVSRDRKRLGDGMWRIRHQDGRWVNILLVLEYQSTIQQYMAVRIMTYTALAYQDLIARNELDNGQLPAVFPVVLYSGNRPWNAPVFLRDLQGSPHPEMAVQQPNLQYHVLDEGRRVEAGLPQRSLVSVMISFLHQGIDQSVRRLREVVPILEDRRLAELEQDFREVLGIILKNLGIGLELNNESALVEQLDMITEQLPAWTAPWHEAGLEEGLEKGLQQGLEKGLEKGLQRELANDRALIVRLVTRKFDATIVERLSPMLNRIGEPKKLARIVVWIMDCDQSEELLARTETLANDS